MQCDPKNRRVGAGLGKRMRVLLSGPGLIGTKHAELLALSDRSLLVGIVAPPHAENIAFAAERGLPLYSSLEDALAKTSFDAAIIASPNEFHMPQALACLKHGIPVLVEKPLAADLGSAALICAEAKKVLKKLLTQLQKNLKLNQVLLIKLLLLHIKIVGKNKNKHGMILR